jgi:preprotein translocase subunit YajC
LGSGFFLILILIFGLMYFVMIRPQRQQQRRHQEMLANLKVGDEVITAGGVYGDVVGVEPDRVSLEIAEDVEVEVARRAISSIVTPEPDEEDAGQAELEEPEPVAEAEAEHAEAEEEAERAEPEEARR